VEQTPEEALASAKEALAATAEEAAARDAERPLHPALPSPTPGELRLCLEYARWRQHLASAQRALRRAAASDLAVFERHHETIADGRAIHVPEAYGGSSRWEQGRYLVAAGALGIVEGAAVLGPLQTVLSTEGAPAYAMASVVGAAAPLLAHVVADRARPSTSFLPPAEQRRQRVSTGLAAAGLAAVFLVPVLGRVSSGRLAATHDLGLFSVDVVAVYLAFQVVFITASLALARNHFKKRDEALAAARAAFDDELVQEAEASRTCLDTADDREATERGELFEVGVGALISYRERLETSDELPLEFMPRWSERTRAELAEGLPARMLRSVGGPADGAGALPARDRPEDDGAVGGEAGAGTGARPDGVGRVDRDEASDEDLDAVGGPGDLGGFDLGSIGARGLEVDDPGEDPDDDPDLLRRLAG
jgi:hypothetical protein